MAATARTKIQLSVTGLGTELEVPINFTTTTTPTRKVHNRQVQASADTDEALQLGDISTVLLMVIECITNDVDIDLDYVSSFDADLTINEGEAAVIPLPAGVVRIKNNDSGEVSTVDVTLIGT